MTDGHKSFCLFIYNCDLLQTHGVAIGFSASGNFSFNHRKANTYSSNEVGCSNRPESDWNTLVYASHYDGRYITIEHDLYSYTVCSHIAYDTRQMDTMPLG